MQEMYFHVYPYGFMTSLIGNGYVQIALHLEGDHVIHIDERYLVVWRTSSNQKDDHIIFEGISRDGQKFRAEECYSIVIDGVKHNVLDIVLTNKSEDPIISFTCPHMQGSCICAEELIKLIDQRRKNVSMFGNSILGFLEKLCGLHDLCNIVVRMIPMNTMIREDLITYNDICNRLHRHRELVSCMDNIIVIKNILLKWYKQIDTPIAKQYIHIWLNIHECGFHIDVFLAHFMTESIVKYTGYNLLCIRVFITRYWDIDPMTCIRVTSHCKFDANWFPILNRPMTKEIFDCVFEAIMEWDKGYKRDLAKKLVENWDIYISEEQINRLAAGGFLS
jgi:hypothetical protein